ncbi:S4 domain-containing protein YaaA [Clostridium cochlearium]|uniref:Ribosome-associated protein n=1 Tax=Clostridium cochlearium TaxID=1494 RepID=A0A239YX40_CLOCO|nr:S4 domain-containing protein YaaA [Clostridium cochlearium]MBV1818779.1 S4 domain-containing protein YaaA [Bacteroidales bacterium MSK.15.36]NSJ90542.1 S4 domain-containing protein YaaA [Coprococcus sp. MSK.21.13]MBE6065659.1 S4 domain-containing protein YaaA [Clostridium cochlearium]MBU5270188.1 S4 domain-containing protein YaaA [Clostridium cochlearium]MCG4571967.1 S4 domain-containing protein YaaA [Clostridium cochlearium]
MEKVKIDTDFIKLDSLLKWVGIANMGSEAKFLIKEGLVKVNSEVEMRRGKKLYKGDKVEFDDKIYIIE